MRFPHVVRFTALAAAAVATLVSGTVRAQPFDVAQGRPFDMTQGVPGNVEGQQNATPSAREIVDRHVRESGGMAALKTIKSIRAKGTLKLPAQNVTGDVETLLGRPSKSITRLNVQGVGKFEEGYDGKIGWSIDPVNGPSLVTGKALLERSDEAWFDAALHTPDFVKDMTVVGRETFDKRPAYRIKVKLASGTEQEELYDVETGFQIGLEAIREIPLGGSAPTSTIYRDYQKFGDLKLPTTQVTKVIGIEQVVTFTSYEFNTVPANAFDLPAVIKALLK